ncbi:ABC transporter permease [Hoeflea alexandrii]|uniref:ABC transporter permease n=1 Tax=Hoeflea alexandrii TaxID=288436 RepID=UPI0022AF4BC1|nr:ABC transporter permease [Hoeflea alexandrii]MCZ4291597.1 ABC transporter permease [Hoeflea alexandrii]
MDLPMPSPRQQSWMMAKHHVGLQIGALIVLVFTIWAVFAPFLAPADPYVQNLANRLAPMIWQDGGSWDHILGTDGFGRDLLSRLIWGTQVTMIVGFGAAFISGVVGTTLGMLGGYLGGKIDAAVIFLINVKLAMPGVLIALSLVSIFGGSLLSITIILSLLFWDRFAVVTRTATQQVRTREYIAAAECSGASKAWILFREILPNISNQIIVIGSLEMGIAILIEAALSFLGLGIQPPTPSWGILVSEARDTMFFKPHLIVIPGLAICILVIGINLLGDGIRDITEPQGRN